MHRLALVVLLALTGCESNNATDGAPIGVVALPTDLSKVLRDYESAYAGRDSSALARLFATDGYLLPLGRPPVHGGPAAAGHLSREGGALRLVPISFARGDSVAFIVGTFGAGVSTESGGKFVLALRRDTAGAWRIAADIANPNGD